LQLIFANSAEISFSVQLFTSDSSDFSQYFNLTLCFKIAGVSPTSVLNTVCCKTEQKHFKNIF